MRHLLAIAALLSATAPALAVEPDEMLADPALEERARAVSKSLRCVVCQSQSIDDSDAPLAKDLRLLVRERLSAGDTDEQTIDYVVDRYGSYVLLKPRLGADTLLLWSAPALLLGVGAVFAALMLRQAPERRPVLLTPEEEAKIVQLLDEERR